MAVLRSNRNHLREPGGTVMSRLQSLSPLFDWQRPRSYWDVVGAHFPLALPSGLALLISFTVPLRFASLIPCTFMRLTGLPCPFCGMTRSMWALSHGDWAFAFYNSPLACLLYLLLWAVLIYNLSGLAAGVIILPGRILRLSKKHGSAVAGVGLILLLLNWIYRLAMGMH